MDKNSVKGEVLTTTGQRWAVRSWHVAERIGMETSVALNLEHIGCTTKIHLTKAEAGKLVRSLAAHLGMSLHNLPSNPSVN